MPLLVAAVWGAFIQVLGTVVGRVLVSLGVGYVSFMGIDAGMAWAKAQFLAGLAGAPAATVQIAGVLKIGVCVSMLLSALLARLTIAGLTGGALKKMVIK